MLKKVVWPLLSFISIVLSIVFIIGFITSINISKAEKEDYEEKPDEIIKIPIERPKNSFQILIMGDSIGFGIGDEDNLGIGERYLKLIKKPEKTEMEVRNISVPGYESGGLMALVQSTENKSIILNADLIIISIGGNDLNRIEYQDNLSLNIAFKEALNSYKENLNSIVREIRSINPEVQLSIIGLYDPFNKEKPEKTSFLLEWNYETRIIVNGYSKFAYIPTYEEFEYHLEEYLSLDDFHPSALGYQAIAETLYRILN